MRNAIAAFGNALHNEIFWTTFNDVGKMEEITRIKPQDAQGFKSRAMAQFLMGERRQAIRDFSESLKRNPMDSDAYGKRGIEYVEEGDWEKALADFDQALEINPDNPYIRARRASVLKKLG